MTILKKYKISTLEEFSESTNVFMNSITIFTEKVEKYCTIKTVHTLELSFDRWGETGYQKVYPTGTHISKVKKDAYEVIRKLIEEENAEFHY